MQHINKYAVEFMGTLTLALIVFASIASGFSAVATPVLAALTLGLFVYTLGHVSGIHINPAVTLGLYSIKKIKGKDATYYIGAQFLGAITAILLASLIFGLSTNMTPVFSMGLLLAEMLGAIIFTLGIASVVYGKVDDDMSGIVIGGSLLLGIALAASLGSNGILNPAIAFAVGSFSFAYIAGPILGSVIGFNLYKIINKSK